MERAERRSQPEGTGQGGAMTLRNPGSQTTAPPSEHPGNTAGGGGGELAVANLSAAAGA